MKMAKYPNNCDECGKETSLTVEIGETPKVESRTVYICLECLKKAVEILEEEHKQ